MELHFDPKAKAGEGGDVEQVVMMWGVLSLSDMLGLQDVDQLGGVFQRAKQGAYSKNRQLGCGGPQPTWVSLYSSSGPFSNSEFGGVTQDDDKKLGPKGPHLPIPTRLGRELLHIILYARGS